MTFDLIKRIWEHKNDIVEGFSKKYQLHNLVYYEVAENKESALGREKQLKKYHRKWKLNLIEKMNPEWEDLYFKLI